MVCDAEPRKAPEPLPPLKQNGVKEATETAPHLPKWVIHDRQVVQMHRPELGEGQVYYLTRTLFVNQKNSTQPPRGDSQNINVPDGTITTT